VNRRCWSAFQRRLLQAGTALAKLGRPDCLPASTSSEGGNVLVRIPPYAGDRTAIKSPSYGTAPDQSGFSLRSNEASRWSALVQGKFMVHYCRQCVFSLMNHAGKQDHAVSQALALSRRWSMVRGPEPWPARTCGQNHACWPVRRTAPGQQSAEPWHAGHERSTPAEPPCRRRCPPA